MFTVKCLVLQISYYLADFCGIDTSSELAANIFLSTTFRERSSLMAMCLRYDKVSQTGQAQDVATCTYS